MPAKGNAFTSAKIIKAKPSENVFFVHLNVSPSVLNLLVFETHKKQIWHILNQRN